MLPPKVTVGVVLLFSSPVLAAGGSCPSGAQYLDESGSLVTLSALGVTSCFYVSKSSGADTKDGTSESSPWAHLPGMPSCTANCAAASPGAGNGFILRGGDTWTGTDLGLSWTPNGTSGSPIYIGVDPAWYSGNAWTRPVWTCGGTACSSGAHGRGDMFDDFGDWLILDDVEVTGFNTASDGVMVQVYGSNVIVEQVYAHGWNHIGESFDNGVVFGGTTCCGGGTNLTFTRDIADGSDTAQDSMVCFFGQITNVQDSVCQHVTNGIEGAFDDIHDNWLGPIDLCFPTSGCHQNAIQQAGPASTTTNVRVYNNVITGVASGGMGHLWVEQSAVDNGALETYVFGNVMFDNQPGNDVDICQEGTNCGTFYFFNNTFECGTDSNTDDCTALQGSGSGPTTLVHYANNQWITSGPSGQGITVMNAPNFTFTETTDLVQTVSLASSQGYASTSPFAFQPGASNGGTVGAGTNEQSLCASIDAFDATAGAACRKATGYGCAYDTSAHTVTCPALPLNPRPVAGPWDIGAYQYGDSGTTGGGDGGSSRDAGCGCVDAGSTPGDGGSAADGGNSNDGGNPQPGGGDAGASGPAAKGGCGCAGGGASEVSWTVLALAALSVARRRGVFGARVGAVRRS
jgi:hypothetical protein